MSAAPDADGLNVTEAAAHLGVSRTTVYGLLRRGEIPHRLIGTQPRFSRAVLTLWLAGIDDLAAEVGLRIGPRAAAPTRAPTDTSRRRTPKNIGALSRRWAGRARSPEATDARP